MTNPRGTGGGLVALGQLPEFDRARSESAAAGGAGPARGPRPGGPGGPGAAPAGPRLYGGTALTAEGESAAAAFAREDNPRFSCETTSILFDWTFDGPVNRIEQTDEAITLRYGQMGLERTIHMNAAARPANVAPKPRGLFRRPLARRRARRRDDGISTWRVERPRAAQRPVARGRAVLAGSRDVQADARLRGDRSRCICKAPTRARTSSRSPTLPTRKTTAESSA